jgi:uncharacterized circularly permuted ATP-grasp superfamily protein/uncharacterized alpha-E superfamily protein
VHVYGLCAGGTSMHPFVIQAAPRYQTEAGRWDECHDPNGVARPGWNELLNHVEHLGAHEINRRWEQCRRIIRENGVTYNLFRDGAAADRPWQLDPLPMILTSDEWTRIERGVAQRALAIDGFLGDAYGEQRLIRERIIPPGLVFGHPNFLRPMHGIQVPNATRLHLYACELVHCPDGQWRVAADLCQAPPGAGYALENRIVLSRALPEPFREMRVQRLAGFFMRLRQQLLSLAPRNRENPRVVLLTPGPYSETYFEHAYLAQYLGISLVQGDDLAVRDERVFLKTLAGLMPVDVVLRRLADDFCDPLELRTDSSLGVLGMAAAVRAGNVAVANSLGSGLADSPALVPYLPRITKALLGQDALIEGLPAWWGGDQVEHILSHLPDLVLRPAWNNRGRPVLPATLPLTELANLAADIRVRPHAYLAFERVARSTVPCWDEGRVMAKRMSLRVFAVRDGDGYAVMPGGLARIDALGDGGQLWFERGGGSKDAWALTDGPVTEVSMLRANDAPLELKRGGIDLPSRVADNLFWLGRYAERAEAIARLVRSALACLAEDAGDADQAQIAAYLAMLARGTGVANNTGQPSGVLVGLIADGAGGPLKVVRDHLRRTAFGVRDRLSADTWRALTALNAELAAEGGEDANQALARLNRVVIACAALAGMGRENTTRGPGWRFLDLGRRIERASFLVDSLHAAFADGKGSPPELEALLRTADSAITYRSRYLTTIQAAPVVDLLLTDPTNPRAVAFQANQIVEHVTNLPREAVGALPTPAERLATHLQATIRLADPVDLCQLDQASNNTLIALFDDLSGTLTALSDAVTTAWLTHVAPSRAFAKANDWRPGDETPPGLV